ncbi:MAG: DNA polymerase III subunit alpha [Thermoanaerobaculia bacterium]
MKRPSSASAGGRSTHEPRKGGGALSPPRGWGEGRGEGGRSDEPRLTLLAESRTGYRNLCRLLTGAALGRPKGEARATLEQVAAHAEGLHCLTGGAEGPVVQALEAGGPEAARRELEQLAHLFPGRLHVELQRHRLRSEEHHNGALLELARSLRLPVVATNGVRYARREDKPLQDVLTAIRHGTTLDAAGTLLAAERERHLKAPEEMAALFADLPEALEGAAELAERLDFTLEDLGYRFPECPLPPGETPASYLRHLAWNGARARFRPLTARAQAQIEKELALIEKLDLAGYFLIVHDLVRFCQREGILVQGRGSAANSAVCYALSITAVDPVKMDLLFERFLSEERGEWPDIDLDLPSGDQREKVIQHVYRRYGERGAAMTANVITYRDRSAAREVAKALGYSPPQVDRLAKAFGRFHYDRSRGDEPSLDNALAEAGFDPAERRARLFTQLWQAIQHTPRHLGQHSGGMVIAAGRLDEVVPLEPAAMEGRVVIQWDKEDCADLGIVKVDLLGLGMLDALEEAVPLVRETEGVHLDLAHLPPDDPATYRMLQEADTVGVFQVESRAQMASLPRNRPERFYDLVIQVAIIRPGPILGNLANPYFERRQGREAVTYPHPSLEPVLARTLGVPIFQEQILRMAMVAAGFSGGEAEELRRAMGFKRSRERMGRIEERLRSGMTRRGITGRAQEEILQGIRSFALYGFPESHAASFALIAYASAYLKAHHPTAFLIALLNAWPMGFYHPATLVQDAKRHGVRVLPIDVNRSEWKCTWEEVPPHGGRPSPLRVGAELAPGLSEPGEPNGSARGESTPGRIADGEPREEASSSPTRASGGRISAACRGGPCVRPWEEASSSPTAQAQAAGGACRLGLRFVKGLRREAGRRIADERRSGGPYRSPDDLARRCRLHDDELATLAALGALGSMAAPGGAPRDEGEGRPLTRREALWQVARAARPAGPLHEGDEDREASPLPEMTPFEETVADFRGAAMTPGVHPVAHVRSKLHARGVVRAADVGRFRPGTRVKTAGSVIVRQRPGTAKGILFVTVEDESGMVQAMVAPKLFQENRALVAGSPGLVIEGIVESKDGGVSIRAERFWPLPRVEAAESHDFR